MLPHTKRKIEVNIYQRQKIIFYVFIILAWYNFQLGVSLVSSTQSTKWWVTNSF